MKIRKNCNANFIVTGVLFLIFLGFTFLVLHVDVRAIGPENSTVGLASVNQYVHEHFGVHLLWYDITDWLGVVAILIALGFGILGLCQLVKRKSLFKVDADILLLGGFYIVMIAVYVFFEICIVNYRPIIMDEGLEASFPSSHVMLVMCIMLTAMIQFHYRIQNQVIRNMVQLLSGIIVIVTVVGRLISGVHWFSDILAGMLLSLASVSLYFSIYKVVLKSEQKSQRRSHIIGDTIEVH